jgi:diketogulonate reductase-like aldo/keto reductase
MIEQLLSRRKFNRFCAALGSSLPATSAIAALSSALETSEAIGAGSNGPTRAVRLRDGAIVPALGLGSARLAQGRHPEAIEEEALRTGLSLGMTLIDTAEVYSNGHSEELIGRVVAGQRDHVFLVSKVWPSHVAGDGIARACEASLARLGTDHLDLYLLHWPNGIIDDLSRIVAGFESLRAAGKIRAWGVSNFTVSDMENLFRVPHGDRCATNQVLYNISNRGIEDDLLPWCEKRGMPVMAYAPLGESSLVHAAYGCLAAAVALAWAIRSGNVIAIPESGSPTHVKENAVALSLTLAQRDLQTLDAAYPPPRH